MEKNKKIILTFLIGGVTYGLIEIIARDYTHWTMVVTGGICFSLFYLINSKIRNKNLLIKCIIASGIITFFEFIVGYITNVKLNMNIWDYSYLPYNLKGQICLQYSMIWALMGIPMTYVANYIDKFFKSRERSIKKATKKKLEI